MPFVFDTSSFRVLENYYRETFRSFWEKFDGLVRRQEVLSVREVYRELEQQVTKEWFRQWLGGHKPIFLTPTAAETEFVARIFAVPHFQGLVTKRQLLKGMPVADPFVVACGGVRSGCVVTEEALKPNAAKIPNACQHFAIDCVNLEGCLDRLGWRF